MGKVQPWSIRTGMAGPVIVGPTHWERFLLAENLDEETLGYNAKVYKFIRENVDRFYIPTRILKLYNVESE